MGIKFFQVFCEFQGGEPIRGFSAYEVKHTGYAFDMNVTRAHKLGHSDPVPKTKVHASAILSHHPPEIHVDSLASGFPLGGGEMFFCAVGMIFQAEEEMVKTDESVLYCNV